MTVAFNNSLISNQINSPPPIPAGQDYLSRELSKGETLYYLGDEAENIYRVEEGLLKLSIDLLTGRERIVGIAGPGDFIGAITPQNGSYQESASALSPHVRLSAIPKDQLDYALKEQLYHATGTHLSRMREVLEDSELPVTARLARTLLRLGHRFGQHADDSQVRLTLPLTHENLAAMIGAARETTTAILGEMRNQGVIQGTRGRYSFNRSELNEFATEASFY